MSRTGVRAMKLLKLLRAWACHWIMLFIDGAFAFLPRSPTKARLINALCRPFFGYGAYWALRSNPREGWRVKELERRDSSPHSDKAK